MERFAIVLLGLVFLPAQALGSFRGRVLDSTGAVIPGAQVALYGANRVLAASAVAGSSGEFEVAALPAGNYELVVAHSDMTTFRRAVAIREGEPMQLDVVLHLGGLATAVTVTPARGEVQDAFAQPVPINVITAEDMARRSAVILPQALREEAGIAVQQTSAHQGAIIVRGLTGQQVLHLFDGVRFNNSTFRPGPNQYLATVDASGIDRVEVVRGPGSSQYGSDSMGGTVNVLPLRPQFTQGTGGFHAAVRPFFRTADQTAGAAAQTGFAHKSWHLLLAGGAERVQDVRAGGGRDSHAAVTRFLGLDSRVMGDRLQDTGFAQFGGHARFGWTPAAGQNFTMAFHRGEQHGGRRYDQLNGGNGNLINAFDPQILSLLYARYQRQSFGWLDSFSSTISVNDQQDDRRFQGGSGNPLAPVTTEENRTRVFGYQAQGTRHIGRTHSVAFGGEVYDEFISSGAVIRTPGTAAERHERGRYPDDTRYTSYGLFSQHGLDLAPRLRLQGAVRYSAFHFRTKEQPSVPAVSTFVDDFTFNGGAVLRVTGAFRLTASASRGFRAPNTSDLSAIGLTSNGFEVSPDEARKAGAMLGNAADAGASSSGLTAGPLLPEKAMNYEGGAKFHTNTVALSLSAFHFTISDFITRRALLLAPGATAIGGQPVLSQTPAGAVITALDARPVLVRANVGRTRVRGLEASAQAQVTRSLFTRAHFALLRGKDLGTGRAPELEGGLPPANGFLSLRWQPQGRAFWMEAYSQLAWRQSRLSSLELADQRMGATRSRAAIASFFNNGAVARGLVANGRLQSTGETLFQVQDRVLGPGVASAPMFLATPGYGSLNLRGGYRLAEQSEITVILENLADRNFRVHGSGIDAPGLNLQFSYTFRF